MRGEHTTAGLNLFLSVLLSCFFCHTHLILFGFGGQICSANSSTWWRGLWDAYM